MNGPEISKLISMAAAGAPAAAKLKKATQDLEAIFMKDLLSAMRKTVKHESLGSSPGTEIYQDLFDQAISESASKNGTLGVAKTIYDQMAPHAIRAAWARAIAEAKTK